MRAPLFFLSFLSVLALASCSKKTETLATDPVTDFVPLAAGKYFTYRLDSTVFVTRGRVQEIHKYQEKNIVDALVSDGLGRPSYRILRYLNDSAGTGPWVPNGTYYITAGDSSVEWIDYNLRFIKLTRPVREGFTWKGNRYLPNEPYSNFFDFQNDADIARWDYTYGSTDGTFTIGTKNYQHVLTVNGVDAALNFPIKTTSVYGMRNYMQEKYAKGIGMVYSILTMIEYQPPASNEPTGSYAGFTVERSLIDHN